MGMWECPDQDEEVGTKHIADTERFQPTSHEPIRPLASEPRELIDLEDEILEDPIVTNLSGVDTSAQNIEDSSPKEDEDNDVDTLIAM